MTSPVGFSNNQPFKMEEVAKNDHNIKEVDVTEAEVSKPLLVDEFNFLLKRYVKTCQFVEGCRAKGQDGTRGQGYVDNAYKELIEFISIHPEFKDQLPKVENSNDDANGVSMPSLNRNRRYSQDWHRRDSDACVIQ